MNKLNCHQIYKEDNLIIDGLTNLDLTYAEYTIGRIHLLNEFIKAYMKMLEELPNIYIYIFFFQLGSFS